MRNPLSHDQPLDLQHERPAQPLLGHMAFRGPEDEVGGGAGKRLLPGTHLRPLAASA